MSRMISISWFSGRPWSFFGLLLLGLPSVVWSGPPMVGDDPGTAERSHLEVIVAINGASRPSIDSAQVPLLDLAYGLSSNTEISLVMARQEIKTNVESSSSGWGDAVIGYKWRFFNNETLQLAISGSYSHAMRHSSARRGLVEDVGIVTLPLMASLEVGENVWNLQIGYSINSIGGKAFDYSMALGHPIGNSGQLWFELWGLADNHFDNEEFNFRVGLDYALGERTHVLAALGGPITSRLGREDELNYDFYLGLQWFR